MNRGTLPPIVGSLTIAAGALSPIATALLIAVTLFCAPPMYAQVLLGCRCLSKEAGAITHLFSRDWHTSDLA